METIVPLDWEKTDTRKLKPEALNERRRRAVRLREFGMTLRKVAALTELSVMTVMSAHKAYQAGGWAAVVVKPRGRKKGDGRQLTSAQEAEIRQLICDRRPEQLQLDHALWSRRAVLQLVQDRLGIELPVRTLGDYLKRWGFTRQKPLRQACERCPAAVRDWLEAEYPRIAARAKAEKAEIHWGGQADLPAYEVHDHSHADTHRSPVLQLHRKQKHVGLMSAVSNQGRLRWRSFAGVMNAAVLLDFLQDLVRDSRTRIFLILDGTEAQHTRSVKAWLADHAGDIEVFNLPACHLDACLDR